MTGTQLQVRQQRAQEDVFVITTFENGWRVRSARNPSKFYLVSMNGAGLRCTCPDYESNAAQDLNWQCKHVLAVQGHQPKTGAASPGSEGDLAEERGAIQSENKPPQAQSATAQQNGPFQMLIKRSISPDGRIDSVSVEFAFALNDETPVEIKSRALKTMKLQNEIVQGFLHANGQTKDNVQLGNAQGNRNAIRNGDASQPTGAVLGRLIDIGLSKSPYGPRFYLNVQVNGRVARFFGTAAQIANAITTAGERLGDSDIEPGLRLDLPCRVITEQNGKYLNVTRILPLPSRANGGAQR